MASGQIIETWTGAFRRALTTDSTDTSFTAPTAPVALGSMVGVSGFVDFARESLVAPARLILVPIGVGANNDAFSMRVWAMNQIESSDLYAHVLLAEYLACTMCAYTFALGSTTYRTCDAATRNLGNTEGVSVETVAPGSDLTAHLDLVVKGATFLKFEFDNTTNTPSMNCLYRRV